MKRFYSHLIEIETLTVELEQIGLADHERHELAQLVDSNIHNVVMDAILNKLSDEEKRNFAKLASNTDHEKVWNFLKEKSGDIEDEIKKVAQKIKQEMKEDIAEAKRKNA